MHKDLSSFIAKESLKTFGKMLIPVLGDIEYHNIMKEDDSPKCEKIAKEYGFYIFKYAVYSDLVLRIANHFF